MLQPALRLLQNSCLIGQSGRLKSDFFGLILISSLLVAYEIVIVISCINLHFDIFSHVTLQCNIMYVQIHFKHIEKFNM